MPQSAQIVRFTTRKHTTQTRLFETYDQTMHFKTRLFSLSVDVQRADESSSKVRFSSSRRALH